MDLMEELKALAYKVRLAIPRAQTEEATKMAMVVPFLRALGYDPSDLDDVLPEFVADVGIKKGEKVDYAVMQGGRPVMLFEAKAAGTCLEGHKSQLFRYFVTVKDAHVAVLTNGVEYLFFTDGAAANVMDLEPFFRLDVLDFGEDDAYVLGNAVKGSFDVGTMVRAAELVRFRDAFGGVLDREFRKPSTAFLKYMMDLAGFSGNLDGYRPGLVAALNRFRGDLRPEDVQEDDASEDVVPDTLCKARNVTEKPAGYEVTRGGQTAAYPFESFVGMTLKYCEECIAEYGFDKFVETVTGHVFFEKSKKRKVFSMDEADMRGFSCYQFDGGLYMLTNYSADALQRIREQLAELFPDVVLEVG